MELLEMKFQIESIVRKNVWINLRY